MAELGDRFWSKVEKTPTCWNWTGTKDRCGYGRVWFNKAEHKAHRVVMGLPEGLVLHQCDNAACVNPAHLYVGTVHENVRDRVARGRGAVGAKNSHAKLNEHQVRVIRNAKGFTLDDLALLFGVGKSNIGHIRSRRNWAHLPT